MFVQHSNVYVMIATRQNCNAASLLFFLHRIVDVRLLIIKSFRNPEFLDLVCANNHRSVFLRQVFKHYFEELEEESLRDNFVVVVTCRWICVLITCFVEFEMNWLNCVLFDLLSCWQYELLDEIMDFGYPQYTEAQILSEFIKTDAYRMEVTQRPPMAVTNAVSWRSEGINYKKNEVAISKVKNLKLFLIVILWSKRFRFQVFLDVVENVNILVNSNGQIIRSDVVGALKMRTYLRLASYFPWDLLIFWHWFLTNWSFYYLLIYLNSTMLV